MPIYTSIRSCEMLVVFAFLGAAALPAASAEEVRMSETYGGLPLHFEANLGQTDGKVRFLAHGSGYSVYLTDGAAVLELARPRPTGKAYACMHEAPDREAQAAPVALRMSLVGVTVKARVSGLEEQAGKVNYFIGRDASKWRSNVPTFAKVQYRDVYPGIDLVYYGNQRELEYDFVIAPGADPKKILLDFQGAERLEVDAQGALVLQTPAGVVHFRTPFVYQETDGIRREIAGSYVRKGVNRVGFQVAAYDRGRPLVVDPVLSYATYLGGSSQEYDYGPTGIAVDASGNSYAIGWTHSPNFPTTAGATQSTRPGGYYVAFVTKLDPTGSALVYSSYLGGNELDQATGIAVDAEGNAYVTGRTASANFPTTAGAFGTMYGGGYDAFVTKLNPSGTGLVYSTYLGGSKLEEGHGIAVDANGYVYLTGITSSTDFPTTVGAFQANWAGDRTHCCPTPRPAGCDDGPKCMQDAFITKLDPTGSALVYSTYLGGAYIDDARSIAVDADGNAYVAGGTASANFPTTPGALGTTLMGGVGFPANYAIADAFVSKLDATGSFLVYSTYLGGSKNEIANGIALDSAGNAYIAGATASDNFPTTPGALQSTFMGWESSSPSNTSGDAFVAKLNPSGSALVYATYVGGSKSDVANDIAVDSDGNAYVTGSSTSANFPTAAGAFQRSSGGDADAFVTKLNSAGSELLYSSYLGGSGFDRGQGIALDIHGSAFVTGDTKSTDFPTTPGAFQPTFGGGANDAFVVKIVADRPASTGLARPPQR